MTRKASDIKPSEITPKELYLSRRKFISGAAASLVAGMAAAGNASPADARSGKDLPSASGAATSVSEKPTPREDAVSYNNFYEFSTGKADVASASANFRTRPWTLIVDGLVNKPKTYDIDAILKLFPIEERVYRFRCVETWSMIIPWLGFPLGDLIKLSEPATGATFVEFTTLFDPERMPGQKSDSLEWPYCEGLRLDEAMHPLTLMATGMYGGPLPNQNGAPIRLVVPWKYGFKSIKSVVRIRLVDRMPETSWSKAIPAEYGFYANVNPRVSHPRWSQATERRVGEYVRRETLMFNGYEKRVAHLYAGMDLRKHF